MREGGGVMAGEVVVGDGVMTTVVVGTVEGPDGVGVVVVFDEGGEGEGVPGWRCVVMRRKVEGMEETYWVKRC